MGSAPACRRGARWTAVSALALAVAVLAVAPGRVAAVGYETADSADRSRVQWKQEPSFPRKLLDAMVLRPLQFVQVVASAAIFLPAYPMAWPFGGGDDVIEACITEPVDRLFRKPLGDL